MTAAAPLVPYLFPEVTPGGIVGAVEAAGSPNVLSPAWVLADHPHPSEDAEARNEAAWLEAAVPGIGSLLARPDWVVRIGTWTERSSAHTHLVGSRGTALSLHRATAPSAVPGQFRISTGLSTTDMLALLGELLPWTRRDARPPVALDATVDPLGALVLATVIDLARASTTRGPIELSADTIAGACQPSADPRQLRTHVAAVAELVAVDTSTVAEACAALAAAGLLRTAGGAFAPTTALAALADCAAAITGGLSLQSAALRRDGSLGIGRLVVVQATDVVLLVRLAGPDTLRLASVGADTVADVIAFEMAALSG